MFVQSPKERGRFVLLFDSNTDDMTMAHNLSSFVASSTKRAVASHALPAVLADLFFAQRNLLQAILTPGPSIEAVQNA